MTEGSQIRVPLCIVGAGPAGITIAAQCARAGIDLCLIERGAEAPGPGTRELAAGEIVGQPYYPLETTRVMALGGSSNHWNDQRGMRSRPLDAIDFEARPEIPFSGWPFGRDVLEPYYRRAHEACGLGPYTYATADWEDDVERPRIPLPDSSVVTSVFQFAPRDAFLRRAREIVPSKHVQVLLHATAFDLVPNESGSAITHLEVMTDPGRKFSVTADQYVLAAGGLENVRLLLLSRKDDFRGVGNEHELVGRFFMEHISVQTGLVKFHDPSYMARLGLYIDHHARTRAPGASALIRAKIGPSPEVIRREGILNSTFFVTPASTARASEGIRGLKRFQGALTVRPRRPPPAALLAAAKDPRGLAAFALERLGHRAVDPAVVLLHSIAEQAPNPDSRVVLGASRDRLGLPVVRLDWRLTDLDRFSIRRAHEILDTEFRRAGLGWVEEKLGEESIPPMYVGNWHHMGTTRMHPDPRQGVVDADGTVHGIGNLHVAGSSLFPTGGYANPTLTIIALALRQADHLLKRF